MGTNYMDCMPPSQKNKKSSFKNIKSKTVHTYAFVFTLERDTKISWHYPFKYTFNPTSMSEAADM